MGRPVAASQSRAVLSPLPVRTALPSGLNATAIDRALVRQGRPDGPSRRRVPEPRRLVIAAGEDGLAVRAERHGRDRALVRQGRPDGPSRRRVPEPRRLVIAAGEDGLAVRAERHGTDLALVRENGLHREDTALPGGDAGPGGVLPARGHRQRRPIASS